MLKNVTLSFVIATCVMHLFCCGIPLALSAASLVGLAGITGAEMLHDSWFGQVETELLIVSGIILSATGIVQFISSRINCRTDGACAHEPCDKKKALSQKIFLAAVAIYSINLVVFLVSGHAH